MAVGDVPQMNLGSIETLDLTGPCKSSAALEEAAQRLLTYMAWPNEEAPRQQYLAALGAERIGELEKITAGDLKSPDWEQIRKEMIGWVSDRYFQPSGGFGTVASAPSIGSLRLAGAEKTKAWLAVGQLLYTIRCIATFHADVRGGASINKSVELMTRFVSGKNTLSDRTRIMQAWSDFKPVAHLCAAYTEAVAIGLKYGGAVQEDIREGAPFFSALGRTLAVAQDYQSFATSFRPHGREAPLIDTDEIFQVPDQTRLREMPASIGPLKDEMIVALRGYRAPKLI